MAVVQAVPHRHPQVEREEPGSSAGEGTGGRVDGAGGEGRGLNEERDQERQCVRRSSHHIS